LIFTIDDSHFLVNDVEYRLAIIDPMIDFYMNKLSL